MNELQAWLIVPQTPLHAVELLQKFMEVEASGGERMTPEFFRKHFEICKKEIRRMENEY